ncbi:MAG: hypothetical protein MJY87_02510 [Fibrobacter sp.]|nr:hypothetical protein [Fibrobacter sp.]
MESKYRYRGNEAVNTGKPVPKEYWNAKRNGNAQEMKRILGGAGFKAQKDDGGNWMIYQKSEKKLENPDIADTYNTVLKMASKRSLVDAVLKATGGSCEFTQDIEDMAATADTYAETSYGDSDYSAQIEDEGLANFRASMDKMHGDCPEAYDDTMQKLGYASIEAVPAAERQKVYRKVYNGLCAYFSARKSAQQEAGEVNGEVENG